MSKEILLTQGKVAIVDDGDFEWLNQWKWYHHSAGYAARHIPPTSKQAFMHRVIMDAPLGMEVDHINGEGLDNRRYNLRLCTHRQNHRNSRKQKGSRSQYKGVFRDHNRQKWIARITLEDGPYHLGRFDDEKDAAAAYNTAAKKSFGAFARLNVIELE